MVSTSNQLGVCEAATIKLYAG
eukprot:SAG31_NODE_19424_length_602_cov_1.379722_1_plen_21_part_01